MNPALAHPAFAPFARWIVAGRLPTFAELECYARDIGLALPDGRPLCFMRRCGGGALAYETVIARDAVIPLHDRAHDSFNALAWLAFPRTKAALNALHVLEQASGTPNQRSRARDAATLLDESGVLLACAEPQLVQLLREHAWQELFVTRRAEVLRHLRVFVIGHGVLEKLQTPFRGITAMALVVATSPDLRADASEASAAVDAAAAAIVSSSLRPEELLPLPLAGLPGWDCEGLGARLFDDVSVFRAARATLSRP